MRRVLCLLLLAAAGRTTTALAGDGHNVFHVASSLVDDDNWWNQHMKSRPAPDESSDEADPQTPFGFLLKRFAERLHGAINTDETGSAQDKDDDAPHIRIIRIGGAGPDGEMPPMFPGLLMGTIASVAESLPRILGARPRVIVQEREAPQKVAFSAARVHAIQAIRDALRKRLNQVEAKTQQDGPEWYTKLARPAGAPVLGQSPAEEMFAKGDEDQVTPDEWKHDAATGVYSLEMNVPGVKSDGIRVRVADDQVSISGSKHTDTMEESFESTVPLPYPGVTGKQVHARVRGGKLTVTVAGPPASQEKKTAHLRAASDSTQPKKAKPAAEKRQKPKTSASLNKIIQSIINMGGSAGHSQAARAVMSGLRNNAVFPTAAASAPAVAHS